jgi:hypothetical protein
MRRRLLDVCLLAYPRARRRPDREYLRDLALDLSRDYGFTRQARSLLRGGVSERLASWRERPGAGPLTWARRAIVAATAATALALVVSGLTGPASGSGDHVEVERLACASVDHPRADQGRASPRLGEACADVRQLAATRRVDGWRCTTQRHARSNGYAITSRCTTG